MVTTILPRHFNQDLINTVTDPAALDQETTDSSYFSNIWDPSKFASMTKNLNFACDFLWKYFGTVVVVMGIVGNVLCIMVFYQKSLRHVPVTIYLRMLALVDLLFIVLGFGLHPDGPFSIKIVDSQRIACKLYFFITGILRSTSTWLVVAFNIERCVAITKPLKLKTEKSFATRVIYGSILGFVVFRGAYGIHALVLYDVVPSFIEGLETLCDTPVEMSPIFIVYVRPWFTIFIDIVIPFIIIIVCNVFIILEVRRSRKLMKTQLSEAATQSDSRLSGKGEVQKVQSIVVMLLTVSIVFLLLNAPLGIAMFLDRFYSPDYMWGTPDMAAQSRLMWTVAAMGMYLNSAINFILYMASGSSFREEMLGLLRSIGTWCYGCPAKLASTDIPTSVDTGIKNGGQGETTSSQGSSS